MLLLDTCALLWLSDDGRGLSPAAREAIAANADRLFVSAISAFEIAIKVAKQRIKLPADPEDWFAATLAARGIVEIPVDGRTAARSARLPALHSDPCDRIIVATARLRNLTIVTPDPLIRAYPEVTVIW